MQPMANMAMRAARIAGQLISRAIDRPDKLRVTTKGPNDYVTNIDREAEAIIIESLRSAYPDHAFLGEESGHTGPEEAEYTWVIDPLDGTLNFVHGIPHFAVSIACRRAGRIEHAVVLDPIKREEFVASRGDGGRINGIKLRVSPLKGINSALIATAIPRRDPTKLVTHAKAVQRLIDHGAVVRNYGCASLDLAYVAAGRFDALWLQGLSEWDLAAGSLLVTEAGGLASDFDGGQHFLQTGEIVCGTPKCFKPLIQSIR